MAIDPLSYISFWQLLQKKMLTKVMDMDSDFFQYMVWAVANVVVITLCIYPHFLLFVVDFAAFCSSLSLRVQKRKERYFWAKFSSDEFHVHEIVENTKHLNKISLFLIQKTVACEEVSNPIYHQSMFFCLYCYHNRSHLIVFKRHGCSTK